MEGQFQLYLEFLGPKAIVLKSFDLLMTLKHVENRIPSLRIYLQKRSVKKKVEQIEKQKLCSKVDLQKVKVKHVKKGSTLHIQVELVDHIYNQKFQKYMDYYCIQKSII